MKQLCIFISFVATLLWSGCAVFNTRSTVVAPTPCIYRFKMLSRPEDQARVEAALRATALGAVTKSGTVTYPEYHFRVARLADLDTLHPKLLFTNANAIFIKNKQQVLNLRTASVDVTFDSTDVSARSTTTITFMVKPGSRLYFKHPGGVESDITAKIDSKGRVALPTTIKEGQKYIYARALKDNVVRYIRINIFTNEVSDIAKTAY